MAFLTGSIGRAIQAIRNYSGSLTSAGAVTRGLTTLARTKDGILGLSGAFTRALITARTAGTGVLDFVGTVVNDAGIQFYSRTYDGALTLVGAISRAWASRASDGGTMDFVGTLTRQLTINRTESGVGSFTGAQMGDRIKEILYYGVRNP